MHKCIIDSLLYTTDTAFFLSIKPWRSPKMQKKESLLKYLIATKQKVTVLFSFSEKKTSLLFSAA